MYTILIVDDSKFSRKNITKHLESLGFNVMAEAVDGLDGIEKAKEHNPTLIVTDIEMPNLDGIGMIKQIKEFNEKVQFIAVTSLVNAQIVHEVVRLGVPVVKKPLKKQSLENAFAILQRQE